MTLGDPVVVEYIGDIFRWIFFVVSYDMIWYDMIWYDMIWFDMDLYGLIHSYISVDLLYQCLIWTFSRWYFFWPYRTRVTFNAALKPGVFFVFFWTWLISPSLPASGRNLLWGKIARNSANPWRAGGRTSSGTTGHQSFAGLYGVTSSGDGSSSCTQVFATFTGWIWISWTLKRWEPKVPQWFCT